MISRRASEFDEIANPCFVIVILILIVLGLCPAGKENDD